MPEALAIALYLAVTLGGAAGLAGLGWVVGGRLGMARFRWLVAAGLVMLGVVGYGLVVHASQAIAGCTECAGDARRSLGFPLMIGWGMALFVTIGVFLAPRPARRRGRRGAGPRIPTHAPRRRA